MVLNLPDYSSSLLSNGLLSKSTEVFILLIYRYWAVYYLGHCEESCYMHAFFLFFVCLFLVFCFFYFILKISLLCLSLYDSSVNIHTFFLTIRFKIFTSPTYLDACKWPSLYRIVPSIHDFIVLVDSVFFPYITSLKIYIYC